MYCPFIQSSFSVLNTALPPLMPSSVKLSISSVVRHQLAIVAGRPPKQREEVHHRVGQITLPLIFHHRRRAMPLAQSLLVGAENQRHMREARHGCAERLEQQHVLRRVRDVIVAADHIA